MTRYTTEGLIKLLTSHCRSCVPGIAAEPVIKLSGLHYYDLSKHARVVHAAVFSAEEPIGAGFGRFEPLRCVFAGHDVGLQAKRGYEEIMDHIFRRHDQLDFSTNRNV